MRVLHLSTLWTVLLDILAWLVIHLAVVAVMIRVPRSRFDPEGFLYRARFWEKRGHLYTRWLRVRSWKAHMPDGAWLAGGRGFPKKTLEKKDRQHLKAFFVETCRAELTHWVIILIAPLFFLWNKTWVGWIMILYALAENMPLILVQRYNRQRFRRVLEMKGQETGKS